MKRSDRYSVSVRENVVLEVTECQVTIAQQLPLIGRRGWTVAEFERLDDAGFFAPEEKLELIEGEIAFKMGHNERHAVAILLATISLGSVFTLGFHVRVQLPLRLGAQNRPEPDLAVIEGTPRDYLRSHPTTAVLVVEVSDSTLQQDREVKSGLYAREGIAEYWIVNLVDRVLEVRRQPAEMSGQAFAHGYRSVQHLGIGQSVSPLAAPQGIIQIQDLLP